MENEVKNNNSIKTLLIIIIILLLVGGGLVIYLILNKDDGKGKETTGDNGSSQVEEKKDETTEEGTKEGTKEETKETTKEETTKEETKKEATKEDNNKKITEVSGLKTNVVYKGSKESKQYEENLEVTLVLAGDGSYNMNYGTVAGNKSAGTYKISNNKLILNQVYGGGSDCTINKATNTYTFDIKNGAIVLSMYDVKDLELKATDTVDPGELFLDNDVCEETSDGMGKMPVSYTYADDENAVYIEFLPFNHYLLVYCNDATCASSYGTYTDNNGKVTLTQLRYQGSDACYYKQSKTFTYTYTKLSDTEIKKVQDELDTVVYYANVKINLNSGNIRMPNKEFTLVKSDKDNDATTFYNTVDFYAIYCGEL